MPDSKVMSVIIICVAVVGSVLIYTHRMTIFGNPSTSHDKNTSILVTAGETASSTPSNINWKQAISDISVITPSSQSAESLADQQSGNAASNDPNNMTSQVAKNFFSLYLQ